MFDYRARCAFAVVTETTREAQRRHHLDPLTTIALGRALGSAALLASILKHPDEYVHLNFKGKGLLSQVLAECNGAGHCRGYTAPHSIAEALTEQDELPQSVGEAIGSEGVLVVTRGRYGQEPYRAVSALQNGEIASDVARYLTDSEQIPSAVAAGVKLDSAGQVLAAGAILVQKLAGANLDDASLARIEQRFTNELKLSDRLHAGATPEQIVALIQANEGQHGLLMQRALCFQCTCSRDKMGRALMLLGEDELRKINDETGKLEMRCHYCSTEHGFKLAELLRH